MGKSWEGFRCRVPHVAQVPVFKGSRVRKLPKTRIEISCSLDEIAVAREPIAIRFACATKSDRAVRSGIFRPRKFKRRIQQKTLLGLCHRLEPNDSRPFIEAYNSRPVQVHHQ
jgi:hypothetical protein